MSHDEVEDYIRDCPDISIPSLMREVVRRAVALRVFGSHRVMAEVVRLWADDQESKIEEIRKARRE